MHLTWQPNSDLSAFHAAWCCLSLPDRTQHCDSCLHSSAEALQAEIAPLLATFSAPAGQPRISPVPRFWSSLFALSTQHPSSRELAELLIRNLAGNSQVEQAARLEGSLLDCKQAFRQTFPNFEKEAAFRLGPLQSLWEAQGPGLLRLIGQQTTPELVLDSARVFVVQPILAGGGYAHLRGRAIHLEGVLTNEHPIFPEVLRLAWLLSQLDYERPHFSEQLNQLRLREVAGLAMIPAVLSAGRELDICNCDTPTTAAAIAAWLPDILAPSSVQQSEHDTQSKLATLLMNWWETHSATRRDWPTSLTTLDRLLHPTAPTRASAPDLP